LVAAAIRNPISRSSRSKRASHDAASCSSVVIRRPADPKTSSSATPRLVRSARGAAQKQPHTKDGEVDLKAALRAVRFHDHVRIVSTGHKAAEDGGPRPVRNIEQTDRVVETDDERHLGGGHLSPIERRRPAFPPADVTADVRPQRDVGHCRHHPPLVELPILDDRERPWHQPIIREGEPFPALSLIA
jgi:hypothetical protein